MLDERTEIKNFLPERDYLFQGDQATQKSAYHYGSMMDIGLRYRHQNAKPSEARKHANDQVGESKYKEKRFNTLDHILYRMV